MTKKFGIDAVESAATQQGKGKNAKVYLKDGDSIIVRIPNLQTCASHYMAHSDFKCEIRPFACDKEKEDGSEDVFDKASKYLLDLAAARYKDRKEGDAPDPDWVFGKRLAPNMRMQFGFYNLSDGQPIIIDLAKKYGDKILAQIKKAGNKIDQYAYEITRHGAESNADYSIQPYLDDLTQVQQGHFEASVVPFDTSLYYSSLFFKDEEKQLKDLVKMGFDVRLIGYEPPSSSATEEVENHNEEKTEESVMKDFAEDIHDTSEIDAMMSEESA